jgi:hypothetical protein
MTEWLHILPFFKSVSSFRHFVYSINKSLAIPTTDTTLSQRYCIKCKEGSKRKARNNRIKCKAQEENNMCRKLVVTNEIFLGARPICYEAYSLPKGEVVELTEKQIKDALKGITSDEVYGMKITEAGELELDTENFFVTNMMKKVHTNTLIPMVEDDCLANLFYIVIGTHKDKGTTMYDVISSRYERTSFTEEKVKTLLDMHIISAGAKMQDGKVVVAPLEKPKAPEPTNE